MGTDAFSVYPLDNDKIEMVAESVYIDLSKCKVDCNFLFKNTSLDTLNVTVGFPGHSEPQGSDGYVKLDSFKSFVDGSEVPVVMEKDTLDRIWYTKKVNFLPKEIKKVRNTYNVRPTWSSVGDMWFRYILKTGANWKGTIGKADIYIKFPWCIFELVSVEPESYTISDFLIEWHLRDLEPTSDIYVHFYPLAGQGELDFQNERILGEKRYEPIQVTNTKWGEKDPFFTGSGRFFTFIEDDSSGGKIRYQYAGLFESEVFETEKFKEINNVKSTEYSPNDGFFCSAKEDSQFDIHINGVRP